MATAIPYKNRQNYKILYSALLFFPTFSTNSPKSPIISFKTISSSSQKITNNARYDNRAVCGQGRA